MSFRRPRFPQQSAYLGHVSEISETFGVNSDSDHNRDRDRDLRHNPDLVQSSRIKIGGEYFPREKDKQPMVELVSYEFAGEERGVEVDMDMDDKGLNGRIVGDDSMGFDEEGRRRISNNYEVVHGGSQLDGEDNNGGGTNITRYRDGDTVTNFGVHINVGNGVHNGNMIPIANLPLIPEERGQNQTQGQGQGGHGLGQGQGQTTTPGSGPFEEDDHDEYFCWWEILLYSLLIVELVGSAFFLAGWVDNQLPSVTRNAGSFQEDRAMADLVQLTRRPRVFGTKVNDLDTVGDLLGILDKINRQRTSIPSTFIEDGVEKELTWNLEFEQQSASGTFVSGPTNFTTTTYRKLPNVVARMEPAQSAIRSNKSVLLNCHFDSAIGSPGAGDNMASCAVILEIIRTLSLEYQAKKNESDDGFVESEEEGLKNTIVFLFNGAEEAGLLGSYGFIHGKEGQLQGQRQDDSGHRWSKNIKTFINLEGMGSGKSLLFRTTPESCGLIDVYRSSVPHPYSLVLAEIVFNSGNFPAFTDFSNFQPISGLELAFVKNGWTYHTQRDNASQFADYPGSLTHMGDNLLALINGLVPLNLTANKTEGPWTCSGSQSLVYFDVFGLFQISYGTKMALILNLTFAFLFMGIWIFEACIKGFPSFRQVFDCTFIIPAGVIATGVVVGGSFELLNYYKPWFSHPMATFVLYGIPSLLTHIFIMSFWCMPTYRKTSGWFRVRFPLTISWLTAKLPLAALLLLSVLSTETLRFSFPILICFVFTVFSFALKTAVFWKVPRIYRARVERLTNFVLGEVPPFLLLVYVAVTSINLLVPFTGHMSTTYWNLAMGFIISGIFFVLFHGLVPLLHFFLIWNRKARFVLGGLLFLNILVINPILLRCLLSAGEIPYGEQTPMRVEIRAQDRWSYTFNRSSSSPSNIEMTDWTLDKNDTGYALASHDANAEHFLDRMKVWNPALENLDNGDKSFWDFNIGAVTVGQWSRQALRWYPLPLETNSVRNDLAPIVTVSQRSNSRSQKTQNLSIVIEGSSRTDILLKIGKKWSLVSWNYDNGPENLGQPNNGKFFFVDTNSLYFKVRSSHDAAKMLFEINLILLQKSTPVPNPDVTKNIGSEVKDQDSGQPEVTTEDPEKMAKDTEDFLIQLQVTADILENPAGVPEDEQFQKFLHSFPSWASVQSWRAAIQKFTIF